MHETRSRSLNRPEIKRKREDSEGNVRSSSKVPRDQSGVRDVAMAKKARKITKIGQRKINLGGKKGESDRSIAVKKPKHLCKSKRKQIFIDFAFVFFSLRKTINRQNRSSLSFVFLCFSLFRNELINDDRENERSISKRKRIEKCSSRLKIFSFLFRRMAQQKSITTFFRKKREISDVEETENVKEVKKHDFCLSCRFDDSFLFFFAFSR